MNNQTNVQTSKRIIMHLAQKDAPPPLKCPACGDTAQSGDTKTISGAICFDENAWRTRYKASSSYRRCIDASMPELDPDLFHQKFPLPEKEGYYWAEWGIVADGTFPNVDDELEIPLAIGLAYVVHATCGLKNPNQLIIEVPGIEKEQPLENFLWRSEKLQCPK